MKSRMSLSERRRRAYEIVEIGAAGDLLSRAYDLFYTLTIILNLTATVLDTYDAIHAKYGALLRLIEFWSMTLRQSSGRTSSRSCRCICRSSSRRARRRSASCA